MSIQAVAWVLEQTIPDPAGKLVLISLANAYNGKSGRCFPSIEQIAVESSCSRSTVKRKLQWLSEMGWISVHQVKDTTGRQMANSYSIHFDLELREGFTLNRTEGSSLNREGFTGEPGEGFNCEPPLKEPEEIPEEGSLSETSSDDAPKSKKKISYPEPFEAFWQAYPRTPNMSKSEAFTAWRKLDGDEQAACITAIPGYAAFLKTKPDLETIHACRFISKRRFEGFSGPGNSALPEALWEKRLSYARREGKWSTKDWGPAPGLPGCFVPPELINETDGTDWRELELAA